MRNVIRPSMRAAGRALLSSIGFGLLAFSVVSHAGKSDTLVMKSNVDDCTWWVDGVKVAEGAKFLQVVVTKEPHEVVVQPVGYIKRHTTVTPPYGVSHSRTMNFTVQDKLPGM